MLTPKRLRKAAKRKAVEASRLSRAKASCHADWNSTVSTQPQPTPLVTSSESRAAGRHCTTAKTSSAGKMTPQMAKAHEAGVMIVWYLVGPQASKQASKQTGRQAAGRAADRPGRASSSKDRAGEGGLDNRQYMRGAPAPHSRWQAGRQAGRHVGVGRGSLYSGLPTFVPPSHCTYFAPTYAFVSPMAPAPMAAATTMLATKASTLATFNFERGGASEE